MLSLDFFFFNKMEYLLRGSEELVESPVLLLGFHQRGAKGPLPLPLNEKRGPELPSPIPPPKKKGSHSVLRNK